MSSWFRTYGFASVADRLIIGALPGDRDDVDTLAALGVSCVLNLVEDAEYEPGAREQVADAWAQAGVVESRLSTVDFGGLSPRLLETAAARVNAWLDDHQTVYIHCRAGRQRSATVAAAALCARNDILPEAALRAIQAMRGSAEPLPHQREDLRRWWDARAAAA